MNKNPIINSLAASLYIVAIVLGIQYGMKGADQVGSIIVPMAMLSLFVLSAAVMGYFFISRPIQLYLDGEKKEAVRFFFRTVATFAVTTSLFVAVVFSRFG